MRTQVASGAGPRACSVALLRAGRRLRVLGRRAETCREPRSAPVLEQGTVD